MQRLEPYERTFDEDVSTPDQSPSTCPECDGTAATSDVETVCVDCGLVIEEAPIDHGPEWRSFENDTQRVQPERTGAPLTAGRHDRGLSTEIGRGTDANGETIPGHKQLRMHRLRTQHARCRFESKRERNQAQGLTEIKRLCAALEVGESLCEQASRLFTTAQEADLLIGRSIEAVAAASVYMTLRCNGDARPLEAVSELVPVAYERVVNAFQVLNRELALPVPPATPMDHVPRLVSELGLGERVEREARELAEQAMDDGVANGRNPAGVAAGCVYAAADGHAAPVTQVEIGREAGVSEFTVRKRWEEVERL
jgi:transcription initiation factor TFIIB